MSTNINTSMGHDHFGTTGDGPAVIIAHGILGSRRNWRSFARNLSAARPDAQIWTIDLRAHGDSRDLPGADTVAACAQDVVEAFSHLPDVVLAGHSFGGKVMTAAAARWPRPVRQLWVLDSALGDREGSFSGGSAQVERVLATIETLNADQLTRESASAALREAEFSDSLVAWMMTNVVRVEGGYRWRFAPQRIAALLEDYFQIDAWPKFSQPRRGSQHWLVRGALSPRWSVADMSWLKRVSDAGNVKEFVLEGAGHWLHADNPKGLLALFTTHLWRADGLGDA